MTCCNRSGNIWTTVTGLPDVRLTPYMGAVVLKVDLQSLEGVDSPLSQTADDVTGFGLFFEFSCIGLVLFWLLSIEFMFFTSDELEAPELASILDADKKLDINIFSYIARKFRFSSIIRSEEFYTLPFCSFV